MFFNDAGAIALGRIFSFIEDIAAARMAGRQIIVVSSGAVALGADALKMKSASASLAQKQALAAIGQSRLMNLYEQGFAKYGLTAAQVLLTEDDFSSRQRYLNLRHTLMTLLDMGVIPVINENDTVSTNELEITDRSRSFGDNDKLSALVMSKLEAARARSCFPMSTDCSLTTRAKTHRPNSFLRFRKSLRRSKRSPDVNPLAAAVAWQPSFRRRTSR